MYLLLNQGRPAGRFFHTTREETSDILQFEIHFSWLQHFLCMMLTEVKAKKLESFAVLLASQWFQ